MLLIAAHMSHFLSPALAATASLTVSDLLAAISLQLDNLEHRLGQDDREGFQEGVAGIDELMGRDIEIRDLKEAGPLEELHKWLQGFRQLATNYLGGELPADEALSDLRFLLHAFPVVPEEELQIDIDTEAFEEAGADPAKRLQELTDGTASRTPVASPEVVLDWTGRTELNADQLASEILGELKQTGPGSALLVHVALDDRRAFDHLGWGLWIELKKRIHGLDEGQVVLLLSPSLGRQTKYSVLRSQSDRAGYGGLYLDMKSEDI